MQAYGKTKKRGTPHSHNECGICNEQKITGKKARQQSKKEVKNEGLIGFFGLDPPE